MINVRFLELGLKTKQEMIIDNIRKEPNQQMVVKTENKRLIYYEEEKRITIIIDIMDP